MPIAFSRACWMALLLVGTGCSVFHRHRAEPLAAVTPPPAPPLPTSAARDLASVMADVLQLTPDQTSQVRKVLNGTVAQVNAARQQYPAQSPQLTAALTRINRNSEAEVRQAIGSAKYKELQNKRPQIQAEMQRR